MISLVKATVASSQELLLEFSDGSHGVWSAAEIIARDTVLTRPLSEPAYLALAFIDGGAGLAWPNGLELSAGGLQRELREAGRLVLAAA